MKVILVIAACAALAACATDGAQLEPRTVIKEVPVPVPTACVPKDTPPPGAYADDGVASQTDPVERMKARAAANQQRKARLAVLEPLIQGCR